MRVRRSLPPLQVRVQGVHVVQLVHLPDTHAVLWQGRCSFANPEQDMLPMQWR
jgi:hypothetical protein